MRQSESFDAIVVGSGISGGWAAKELTERGLRVLLLERGKHVEHQKDYVNARKGPWEYPYRAGRSRAMIESHPVLRRDYPLNEKNLDWWVDEQESPYTEVKRFDWYRGYHLGGRSLTWGRQSYRLSDLDFEANAKEGIAIDWPVRYADIAPWYDHVERHAGISGSIEGLPQLPDGQFQPPMPLNCAEVAVAARVAKRFANRRIIPGRVANLTQPLPGRGRCQYRNACALGCPSGSYFSTQASTLPFAMATGRLTLKTHAIVTDVVYDATRKRATGVRVMDALTHATTEYRSKVVFLCASTLNSTAVLLNTRSARYPDGLGNDSGELGHNLMDHHNGGGATASFSGLSDRYYRGRRSTSMYIPRFRNVTQREDKFKRGYGYEVYTNRGTWTRGVDSAEFGADFKNEITRPGEWQLYMEGYGETLPYHDNRIWLSHDKPDRWGIPRLNVSMSYRDNERAMAQQMMDDAVEMMQAAKLENVKGFNNPVTPGSVIHEMGTARMGRDPKTSVLNAYNQVHAVPNVFVTDGSCMVSSPTQNPSLTYMALTARAASHAVEQLKRGEL